MECPSKLKRQNPPKPSNSSIRGHPLRNDFAIAEEFTLNGHRERRPDLVLYVNGMVIGVIDLKESRVSISEDELTAYLAEQKAKSEQMRRYVLAPEAALDLVEIRRYLKMKAGIEKPDIGAGT
jgi:type I site-specific restriction-modification system R (restriction) subunit